MDTINQIVDYEFPCCRYCDNSYVIKTFDNKTYIAFCDKCGISFTLSTKGRNDYILYKQLTIKCSSDSGCPCYIRLDMKDGQLRYKCNGCSKKTLTTVEECNAKIETIKAYIATLDT